MTATAERPFLTPEGVALRLRIGSAGERIGAFLIDVVIIWATLLVLSLGAIAASLAAARNFGTPAFEGGMVVWLVGSFVLRNFYFAGFELGPRAATPGKRAMGLRVIARNGGRLSADAIFARNAMREIELFLPLSTMVSVGLDGGWMILLGLGWTGAFLLFPLFNRDRMRIGDLVAGTLVVHARRRKLQAELVGRGEVGAPDIAFTPEQLDAYGVKELQVLEAVLRNNDRSTMAAVAKRIRGKIGWSGTVPDREFLNAYYGGLRARLEQQMLFGRRRRDKHDRG